MTRIKFILRNISQTPNVFHPANYSLGASSSGWPRVVRRWLIFPMCFFIHNQKIYTSKYLANIQYFSLNHFLHLANTPVFWTQQAANGTTREDGPSPVLPKRSTPTSRSGFLGRTGPAIAGVPSSWQRRQSPGALPGGAQCASWWLHSARQTKVGSVSPSFTVNLANK